MEAEWEPAGEGRIAVVVRQIQKAEPYDLDLDVLLIGAEASARHTIRISGLETRVELDAAGEVQDVKLDPDYRLLVWKPEYGKRPRKGGGG